MEVETRATKDGVGLWKTGLRGVQSQVETEVDVSSLAAAVALQASYAALSAAGAQAVSYAGVSCGTYQVLNVQSSIQPLAGAVGGLSGAPTHVVKASWTLIGV